MRGTAPRSGLSYEYGSDGSLPQFRSDAFFRQRQNVDDGYLILRIA